MAGEAVAQLPGATLQSKAGGLAPCAEVVEMQPRCECWQHQACCTPDQRASQRAKPVTQSKAEGAFDVDVVKELVDVTEQPPAAQPGLTTSAAAGKQPRPWWRQHQALF
mmetsp:Transcript_80621/g.223012  ORF Transcript_80621/g.223012 Transcript_80621/m.223012 type:complete len:109 (-) Transcript_80621:980-1306(-)